MTLKEYDMKRELRVRKYLIWLLVGLIALMWVHFVWHVPLPACPVGDTLPCL